MINEYDVQKLAVDDDDVEILGAFNPDKTLYNLKKEIKLDRKDLGKTTLRNVKIQDLQMKMENSESLSNSLAAGGGKTLRIKQ